MNNNISRTLKEFLNSGNSTSQAVPGLALVSPGVCPVSGSVTLSSSAYKKPRELNFGMVIIHRG